MKRGLYLHTNGFIGQQGSTNDPSDNQWLGNWTGNNGTLTDGTSSPTSSSLFIRTTGSNVPPNNANIGNVTALIYNFGNGLNTASGSQYSCTTSGGGGCQTCREALLTDIASDNVTYTANVTETKEINKGMVYDELFLEPSLAANNSTLSNFYNSHNMPAAFGEYKAIEAKLGLGNLALAQSQINAFNPGTNIENSNKLFFTLQTAYQQNGNLTLSENTQLQVLAYQCPFVDGQVVYRARALYNQINSTIVIYDDNNCGNTGYSYKSNTSNGNTVSDNGLLQQLITNEKINKEKFKPISVYELFPNPAQDEVFINSLQNVNEKVIVKITDASGKLLVKEQITITNHIGKLKLNLLNGIYIVSIINKENQHEYKKLIISK